MLSDAEFRSSELSGDVSLIGISTNLLNQLAKIGKNFRFQIMNLGDLVLIFATGGSLGMVLGIRK